MSSWEDFTPAPGLTGEEAREAFEKYNQDQIKRLRWEGKAMRAAQLEADAWRRQNEAVRQYAHALSSAFQYETVSNPKPKPEPPKPEPLFLSACKSCGARWYFDMLICPCCKAGAWWKRERSTLKLMLTRVLRWGRR